MRSPNLRVPKGLFLLVAPLFLGATAVFGVPHSAVAPPAPVSSNVNVLAFPPTLTPSAEPPTPTPAPPTPVQEQAPVVQSEPTPTPPPVNTVPRIGLQVGHWKSNELPDELKRLRSSTGTSAGGVTELQVNLDITQRVARILEERGYVVDVIPATVPVRYEADAFVAIHADGSASSRARGFKLATPWRTSRASQHLLEAMQAEYAKATGLPYDSGGITFNMRGYYAFSWRRHDHAAAKTTPAVILEMGFLTNASDRSMMTKRQDMIALAIADGITRYLNERDPNDTAARVPPDFKTHRPVDAGVAVRAAPSEQSKVLFRAGPDNRLFPFQEKDGWMQVVVRGQYRVVGWVRRDQLVETDDPQPTPLPATDS